MFYFSHFCASYISKSDSKLKIHLIPRFDPFLQMKRIFSDGGWSDQRVSNSDDWPLYQVETGENLYVVKEPWCPRVIETMNSEGWRLKRVGFNPNLAKVQFCSYRSCQLAFLFTIRASGLSFIKQSGSNLSICTWYQISEPKKKTTVLSALISSFLGFRNLVPSAHAQIGTTQFCKAKTWCPNCKS